MKQSELELLREVVRRRQPSAAHLLERMHKIQLTSKQREELRGVLAEELGEYGLTASSEVNAYGRRIDSIIGALGSI